MSIAMKYLNASAITQLRNRLQNYTNTARSQREYDAYAEGVACLKDAQPNYLSNLIPADHPDRIECLRLIEELELA